MLRYFAKRLAAVIPTIFLVTIIIFCLQQLLPGDPAVILAGEEQDPNVVAYLHQKLHLDEPLPVRYGYWMTGVVHGDLSEFNILLAADGPVIIDLPQAVDAAGNNHAQRMLLRDVTNLRNYFGRFAPELLQTDYGGEIWDLYQRGLLHPDGVLTGRFHAPKGEVDLGGVLREIDDTRAEEAARRLRQSIKQKGIAGSTH